MTEDLKKKYLDFLSEKLNNFDYFDVDSFMEDNKVSDKDAEKLLAMSLSVVEER